MDGLISFGLLAALLSSWVAFLGFPGSETYFDTVSMGVFVLLIGRALETLARVKSGNVTETLLGMQQRWATRIEGGQERVVPIQDVRPGDRLVVKMGEAFPTDGTLAAGETEADESALTGESRPRFIVPGERVVGGTLNTGAAVVMESRTVGANTVLGRIARLVETAQQNKAPVQRMADRIAGHFALAVVALSGGSVAWWLWLARAAPPQPVWVIAIAVIIIACPCGLGLATPMAVLVASAAAARRGILVKGGEALESAARVTDVVLDKTGTLTEGRLAVTRVLDTGAMPRREWLGLAAAVEQRIVHPLAAAIVAEWRGTLGRDAPLAAASGARAHPGRGAEGRVGERHVLIGNERWLREAGLAIPSSGDASGEHPEPEAETRVYVAVDRKVAGMIRLADPVRADAAETVRGLKALGIRVHVFSGDRAGTVAAVVRGLDLDSARGEMLPEHKVEAIAALQKAGAIVAMVGDGLNDAPALTSADVGIAVATGSDLALQSAQILLLRPLLKGVLESLTIARRTFAIIRQNLALSVVYNLLAIPLAIAGLVIPLVAAVSMAASSLLVVANSLRGRREVRAEPSD
jgi:heavy metal translocating P-type ATPase